MGMFSVVMPSSLVLSTFQGFPMDMDDWNCEQWKQYYLRNKAAQGKDKAISIINNDSARVGMFADLQYCTYDCDWSAFFAKEGIDPSSIFSYTFCGIVGVTKNAVDIAKDTSQTAANVTSAVSKATGSNLITLAVLGGLGYMAYKKFIQ